jgi:putative ABC transport system permease protein
MLALALGVALGVAVYLVNTTALNEFGLASKRLVGEADIIVRGPAGFDEHWYPDLVRTAGVAVASPVLELEAALPGRREPLKILGLDPLRAAQLSPALLADIGGRLFDLFQPRAIFLSASAARQLKVRRGDRIEVTIGGAPQALDVIGILTDAAYPQALGLMDIGSAQWTFERLGRINRIDLRLTPGTSVQAFLQVLQARLPPGVLAITPAIEVNQALTATRAYRVNLNMLASVALFTGAFLVFSTQSLSVLRRRRSLALLRALGVTRGELQWALIGEGAALGMGGSALGLVLGFLCATALLRVLTGDLGNGQLHASVASLGGNGVALACFFVMGTAVASAGAWLPARNAARQPPARELKGGDSAPARSAGRNWLLGTALLVLGAVLARLPAVHGLPVFGYASVGLLLFGAVLLVPFVTVKLLRLAPRFNRVVWDTSIAQLRENVALSTLSLASIIVSFSLMVAMAIMVYSFRVSFEHWLGKLLPADLQMREPFGNDTAFWGLPEQAKLAALPGIARIDFRRTRPIVLDPARPAITLIARGANGGAARDELPLIESAATADPRPSVWVSEAMQDLYGLKLGATLTLPLAGHYRDYRVAGVWRDYARAFGAVVMSWPTYLAATGDPTANEASVWLNGRLSASAVEAALRGTFERGDAVDIMTSTIVREKSLQIFDRAFAITYALEAIAVIIGLTGISFAASSTALARRSEFGMLRHIGMLRRQVIGIVACEGLLTSTAGVLYGLTLGVGLSLVLVYVVNRQSFNWSIDLAIPVWQLATLSVVLIVAAALTALASGRGATSREAVLAVREDW